MHLPGYLDFQPVCPCLSFMIEAAAKTDIVTFKIRDILFELYPAERQPASALQFAHNV